MEEKFCVISSELKFDMVVASDAPQYDVMAAMDAITTCLDFIRDPQQQLIGDDLLWRMAFLFVIRRLDSTDTALRWIQYHRL